jgi:DNA-binding NarL/FixJ family response regulator
MSIRLAIFEDNISFVDALSVMIQRFPELELTGVYTDTSDIVRQLSADLPDVVLMDINIGPSNGIESTRLILRHFPAIKILIQTVFEDDNHVFAAICAGASGYILKRHLPSSLFSYIKDIFEGGAPMSPNIAQKILVLFREHFPVPGTMEDYNLTKREKQILKYLVEGSSYKMIADKCNISIETVKTHFKRMYEKLHVASMTEAVAKAIHEKLT